MGCRIMIGGSALESLWYHSRSRESSLPRSCSVRKIFSNSCCEPENNRDPRSVIRSMCKCQVSTTFKWLRNASLRASQPMTLGSGL